MKAKAIIFWCGKMFKKIQNWVNGIVTESKAITWPSKVRVYSDSMTVIVSLVVGGLIIAGIDYTLLQLFKLALSKVG
jgi:preprotein translocase SecE subunit